MESKNIRRGDIYYVRGYSDAVGSEQKANGRSRPAIVISNNIGNKYSKIKQVVYITTKNNYNFVVASEPYDSALTLDERALNLDYIYNQVNN